MSDFVKRNGNGSDISVEDEVVLQSCRLTRTEIPWNTKIRAEATCLALQVNLVDVFADFHM